MRGKNIVPGIFLKANLFGDGQRQNNQDCGNNDGKFAVSVPFATANIILVYTPYSYHCNTKRITETCEKDEQALK